MNPKVVVVGSSDGLGLSIVKQLGESYSRLIWGRDETKTKTIAENLNLPFVLADVRDYHQVELAMQQSANILGGIDIVINCAGIWAQGLLENQDATLIQDLMQTNALGSIWIAKTALSFLLQSPNQPMFVNVISEDGLTFKPQRAVYTSSKWAMTGLTKSLQLDWQSHNIRVTGVYPGPFKSNLFQKAGVERDFSNSLDVEQVAQKIVDLISSPDIFTEELIIN